jgi:hypothetical protein
LKRVGNAVDDVGFTDDRHKGNSKVQDVAQALAKRARHAKPSEFS